MEKLELRRLFTSDQGTVGALRYRGRGVCLMLELPWRGNRPNMSCIPAGEYVVRYMARSGSGRYKDVYHVIKVVRRSGILVHPGNVAGASDKGYKTHSLGCQLPAMQMRSLNGQLMGIKSRQALRRIHAVTGRKDFLLTISWS